MANQTNNVLTEEFLMDVYRTCLDNEYILAVVVDNIKKDYLPDKDFIKIHTAMSNYYKEYKHCPSFSILKQSIASDRGAVTLAEDIYDTANVTGTNEILEQLEQYIKQVRFQKTYKEVGELYNKQEHEKAQTKLNDYATWSQNFSLRESDYVNVIDTFGSRFKENRQKHNSVGRKRAITRFYIDELDERNGAHDLRTQLTCFMAATGVGKSHVARHIGANACRDGLNVLHFSLEGSKAETVNAYSAAITACDVFRYETGTIRDAELEKMEEELKSVSGKLYVKSYPKFNCHVSTIDIKNGITEFKKRYGVNPDVVIVDSMDLLTDSSGRQWGENGERHKRIAVANDLKDLAADEDVWMVVTYQATIENREWINDEKNVLTEYNTSEAKGLSRPLTHLITLNQSDREAKEETMRIHVAKARWFKKGEPFRIATDYQHEQFYDRVRTMNINKAA